MEPRSAAGARGDSDGRSQDGARSLWHTLGRARVVALLLVVAASGALASGLLQPVVELRSGLSWTSYSVVTGILDLAEGGNVLLAALVFAFSVVFPIAKLGALAWILFVRLEEARRRDVLRHLAVLGRWSMLDVFVVAILVGSVQLGILADARPRIGLILFGAGIVLSMIATMTIERFTRHLARPTELRAPHAGRHRWIAPLGGALFVAGLFLPLMSVERWVFWENEYSILRGTWRLAQEGELQLAFLIVLFVMALPTARFLGLGWIRWRTPSQRALRVILLIDKWAMLDVFGLALLVVLVKVDEMASVELRPGFWILLGAVSLSVYDSWTLQRDARR